MIVTIEYGEQGLIQEIRFERQSGRDGIEFFPHVMQKILEKTVNDNFYSLKNEILYDQGIITEQELKGEVKL